MLKIHVPDSKPVRGYEFNGQQYSEQEAAIYAGGHFPLPFILTVKAGNEYPKGDYTLDPSCIVVNEKRKLAMKGVRLLPMSGTSAKA